MKEGFKLCSKQGVKILKSTQIPFCHGFTTINGGVGRKKEYRGLNLGVNSEDKQENIMENYRRLCSAFSIDQSKIAVLNQVHSESVYCVRDNSLLDGVNCPSKRIEGDGLITAMPGVTLMVFYADCVPVLLCDPVKKVVGAVHSGWRGTVKGIAAKSCRMMQEEYGCRDIICAIGPSIGICHFETGMEVYAEFKKKFGDAVDQWVEIKGDKAYISMQDCIREDLIRSGAKQVDIAYECSICANDRYYSHRCGDLGRMAAFITAE